MNRIPARSLLACLVCVGLQTSVHAAGFALIENSASGMGNAYAGAAAIAEDASTVWFNPAGMSELSAGTHTSVAGHIIIPSADFTNQGSWVNPALTGGSIDAAQAALNGRNDDGGKAAFVPNSYAVRSLNDKLTLGIGVNAPFGLGTDYEDDWFGRYNALDTEALTINVNPSLSYKFNDNFSVGAGVNAQYIHVELSTAIDSAATCRSIAAAANNGNILSQCLANLPALGNAATDTVGTVEGDDISFGYNFGMLFKPTPATKIGLSYRSKIDHELEGDATYDVNAALQPVVAATGFTRFDDTEVKAIANLPASTSLSVAHQVNDKLELLADFTRMEWSSYQELRITNAETGATVTNETSRWNDVNRYALGVNYQYNNRVKLRGGVAYDESPVPSALLRSARTPDNDRTWVSLGANYQLNKRMSLDFGYAHLFTDETPIDNTSESSGYRVRGLYDSSVDIVSAQFNWSF